MFNSTGPAAVTAALRIESVAKQQESYRLQAAVSATIDEGLGDVYGFCGCLVMLSNQQARLVTVITFWTGRDHDTRCANSAEWVQKLLLPYLDHCLCVRSFNARLPRMPTQNHIFEPQAIGSNDEGTKKEFSIHAA